VAKLKWIKEYALIPCVPATAYQSSFVLTR